MKNKTKNKPMIFMALFTAAQIFFCAVVVAAFESAEMPLWQKLALMVLFGGLYFLNLLTSVRRISLHNALSASVLGSFLSLGVLFFR